MRSLLFSLLSLFIVSCQSESYTPKPRAFPRIDFPATGEEKENWKDFSPELCPFEMKIPAYAKLDRDSTHFEERAPSNCWFDVAYPSLNGRVHFSYLPATPDKTFDELRADAFKMAGWHNRKANYIEEQLLENEHGVMGLAFKMEGPVATPYQFFVTDSAQTHFLRGAVYVKAKINVDSLAPVYDFILKDVNQMVETMRWK